MTNDIYHRTYYKGKDFGSLRSGKSNLPYPAVDSVMTSQAIFYLVKPPNSHLILVNNEGKIQHFSDRFNPIKCIRNYVLGKRRKEYVIYNPETKSELFFKDETPLNIQNVLTQSTKLVEEFVIESNRILKIDPSGIASLLTLKGKVIYDFNASEIDNSISPMIRQLSEVYECPDKLDFEELKANSFKFIHIQCPVIDMKDIVKLEGVEVIIISDVNEIKNSQLIQKLLNRNVHIEISGTIKLENIKIDIDKINSGSLNLNNREILSKN